MPPIGSRTHAGAGRRRPERRHNVDGTGSLQSRLQRSRAEDPHSMKRIATALAAAAALAALSGPLFAQAPQGGPRPDAPARPAAERRLPADSVTQHAIELPGGRTLRFTATAGSIQLPQDGPGLQAEIGFVAYTLEGGDRASRPVTFALNGGPGAA